MFKSQLEPPSENFMETQIFVENIFDTVKKAREAKAARSLAESKLATYDYAFDLSPSKRKKVRKTPKKKPKVASVTSTATPPKKKPRKPRTPKDEKAGSPTAKKTPRKYTKRAKVKPPNSNDIDDEEAAFILSSISQRSFDSFYNRFNGTSTAVSKIEIPLETVAAVEVVDKVSAAPVPSPPVVKPDHITAYHHVLLDHNYWVPPPPPPRAPTPPVVTPAVLFPAATTPEVNNNKLPLPLDVNCDTNAVKKRWLRQATTESTPPTVTPPEMSPNDMKTPLKKRRVVCYDDTSEINTDVTVPLPPEVTVPVAPPGGVFASADKLKEIHEKIELEFGRRSVIQQLPPPSAAESAPHFGGKLLQKTGGESFVSKIEAPAVPLATPPSLPQRIQFVGEGFQQIIQQNGVEKAAQPMVQHESIFKIDNNVYKIIENVPQPLPPPQPPVIAKRAASAKKLLKTTAAAAAKKVKSLLKAKKAKAPKKPKKSPAKSPKKQKSPKKAAKVKIDTELMKNFADIEDVPLKIRQNLASVFDIEAMLGKREPSGGERPPSDIDGVQTTLKVEVKSGESGGNLLGCGENQQTCGELEISKNHQICVKVEKSEQVCGGFTIKNQICGEIARKEQICGELAKKKQICDEIAKKNQICGEINKKDQICGEIVIKSQTCGEIAETQQNGSKIIKTEATCDAKIKSEQTPTQNIKNRQEEAGTSEDVKPELVNYDKIASELNKIHQNHHCNGEVASKKNSAVKCESPRKKKKKVSESAEEKPSTRRQKSVSVSEHPEAIADGLSKDFKKCDENPEKPDAKSVKVEPVDDSKEIPQKLDEISQNLADASDIPLKSSPTSSPKAISQNSPPTVPQSAPIKQEPLESSAKYLHSPQTASKDAEYDPCRPQIHQKREIPAKCQQSESPAPRVSRFEPIKVEVAEKPEAPTKTPEAEPKQQNRPEQPTPDSIKTSPVDKPAEVSPEPSSDSSSSSAPPHINQQVASILEKVIARSLKNDQEVPSMESVTSDEEDDAPFRDAVEQFHRSTLERLVQANKRFCRDGYVHNPFRGFERRPLKASLSFDAPATYPPPAFSRSVSEVHADARKESRWCTNGAYDHRGSYGSFHYDKIHHREPITTTYSMYRAQKASQVENGGHRWAAQPQVPPVVVAVPPVQVAPPVEVISPQAEALKNATSEAFGGFMKEKICAGAAILPKTKTASSDPRLNPSLVVDLKKDEPATPRKKLSLDQYRKRKSLTCITPQSTPEETTNSSSKSPSPTLPPAFDPTIAAAAATG